MPVGKPLHLRLFLEGEEVPVIAAQVSIGLNAPAAASIQIVPLDEAMDLKPRTMVHLFFLDSFDVQVKPSNAQTRNEEDRLNIPFLDNYKLLFAGETVGFQFVQTPGSRAVVLQCLDHSVYWDSAHATAIEYGPNGNAFTHQGSLRASNTGLFDDIVNTTSDQLVRWITERPLTEGLKNVSGLAGGVIRVLEMMGGVPRHHKGVNDFFTIAELRCRVLAQIAAEENDTTAAGLLKVSVFDEWIRNGLQNIGQQISFRDMLKLLFGYIHYEVVPNPAAKFDETVNPGTTTNTVNQKLKDNPTAISAVKTISQVRSGLGQTSKRQEVFTGAASSYKATLGEVISGLKVLRDSKKGLSSDVGKTISFLEKAVRSLESIPNPIDGTFVDGIVKSLRDAEDTITQSKNVVSSSYKTTNGSTQRLRSQIIRPDCFFAPPPRCNVIFPEQYTQLSYDRSFLSEATRSLVLSYNTLVGKEALLADRILAPSVGADTSLLAVKPGKEGYRALMKHELHTGIIPRSEWLPNISSFSSKTSSSKGNVKDERLGWARKIALFHFFKYRFGPRQAGVGGRFNPYVVCGFPALVITRPFIVPGTSQAANASDASVVDMILSQSKTGDANKVAPSQLIGMVVGVSHSIDQNGGSTSISMTHVRKHLGIDDEFLGVFLKSKGSTTRRIQVRLSADEVAKSSRQSLKELLLKITPQTSPTAASSSTSKTTTSKSVQKKTAGYDASGNKVVSTTTTTYQVSAESQTASATTAPALTQFGTIDKISKKVLVPSPPGKATVGSPGVFGKIIGVEVVDAGLTSLSTQVATGTSSTSQQAKNAAAQKKTKNKAAATVSGQVFKDVILYEEVSVPTETSMPIEEIIRPRWFSQAYTNENIGKRIYQPFFGVPSIIDEAAFDGLGATVSSLPPTNSVEGDPKDPDQDLDKLKSDLSAEENARARLSIERSVNFISYIYGLVKTRGLDVDDFIRQYANRPIATLPQILGDPDLDFSVDSQGKATVKTVTDADGKTRTPRIGFHSMAVHPTLVDNTAKLAGLLEEPELHVQRINSTGKAEPIPPEYDVRKEKKDRVRRYIAALSLGPGYRG